MNTRLKNRISRIRLRADEMRALPNDALKSTMTALRGLEPMKALDEAFACVFEAFRRVMGITPYDEQLLGAYYMAKGCVAQMQTGEGKTVTAVFPACLYALSGCSVCVATVNPYLAQRDLKWMRPVYELLGFTIGLIEAGQEREEKQTAYKADVVYGTHSEFGFDYLRDQLVQNESMLAQPKPYFMLVDEADNILLDEAVTPMILSGQSAPTDKRIFMADTLMKWLKGVTVQTLDEEDYDKFDREYDYIVMRRERIAILTSLGQEHAQKYFPMYDLNTDAALNHLIFQALQAHGALKKDIDYIVTDGNLFIVDPNTGRVAEGRRFCDGLWQALECKEKLELKRESTTLASISYQQFFKRYPLLCGMTGTAWEEKEEFSQVYALPVKRVPPHEKCIRRDEKDVFCESREAQIENVCREAQDAQKRGQPCLIVTRSVEDSEELDKAMRAKNMTPQVLNARNPEREAAIIADAGLSGHLTVATAMAGRGTDIKLDAASRKVGGLYVIGLGHQNTRRGDRQLMGRAGRQGDPGVTRFFVSPDDELLTRFGTDKQYKAPGKLIRAVRRAQMNCEGGLGGQRMSAMKLDEVIGRCRNVFYETRRKVLLGYCPEAYRNKPPFMARSIMLSEMDSAWAAFLYEADAARQNSAVLSLTGHDAQREYVKGTGRLFDAIDAEMRDHIAQRMACLPDLNKETGGKT